VALLSRFPVSVSWARARERVGWPQLVVAAFFDFTDGIMPLPCGCESETEEQALLLIKFTVAFAVAISNLFVHVLRSPKGHSQLGCCVFVARLNLLWRINQIFTFRNWRLESAVAKFPSSSFLRESVRASVCVCVWVQDLIPKTNSYFDLQPISKIHRVTSINKHALKWTFKKRKTEKHKTPLEIEFP